MLKSAGEVKRMQEDIRAALEELRARLNAEGGDVLLLDVHENVVHVQLLGACDTGRCRFTLEGLRARVQAELQRRCPQVREVVAC